MVATELCHHCRQQTSISIFPHPTPRRSGLMTAMDAEEEEGEGEGKRQSGGISWREFTRGQKYFRAQ